MRYTPAHKQKTRARILDAAAAVFRRQGYHATGVDKVMEEAGLTAGGFYAHFPSKDALLAEALDHLAARRPELLEKGLDDTGGQERAATLVDRYLTTSHREHPERGCPIPSLASEVGRAGKAPRMAFERLIRSLIAKIAGHPVPADAEDRAIAIVALCVGGMSLARAVDDPGFSDRILAVCREFARESVGGGVAEKGREPTRRRRDDDTDS